MTRHVDVMIDDTTLFDVMMRHVDVMIDDMTVCLMYQTECCFVVHYIKVSCHHIKQSVVSSLIISKYRVLTSIRVSCRRSLHQRVVSSYQTECRLCLMWWHDIWCNERRHDTLFDMMTRYFDVMNDDRTRHFDVMNETRHSVWCDDTTLWCNERRCNILFHIKQSVVSSFITSKYRVITSNRVLCRRSLHQSVVSSHQTECRVVVHYIKLSCHHINQSVALCLVWWHDTLM
jgi:hypothetical protein